MLLLAVALAAPLPDEVLPSEGILRSDVAHLYPIGPPDPNAPCTTEGNTQRSVMRFDARGRPEKESCYGCENMDKDVEDYVQTWTRDAAGNVTGFVELRRVFVYDDFLVEETTTWTLRRDDAGRLLAVEWVTSGPDPRKARADVGWDGDRLVEVRLAEGGRRWAYRYTWSGDVPTERVELHEDEVWQRVAWTWEGGHPVRQTTTRGDTVTEKVWTRRTDGTLVRVQSGASRTEYDEQGRMVRSGTPGEMDTYRYDARGNLVDIGRMNAFFPVSYSYGCHE